MHFAFVQPMRNIVGSLFLMAFLVVIPAHSQAAEVSLQSLVLLQPDFVLQERISDVNAFADFTKRAEKSFQQMLIPEKLPPSSGYMVLAVRSKDQVNVWFDMEPMLPNALEIRLKQHIRKTVGTPVTGGTAIVAISLSINGAKAPEQMPNPKEWRDAAKANGKVIEAEDLVDLVWK